VSNCISCRMLSPAQSEKSTEESGYNPTGLPFYRMIVPLEQNRLTRLFSFGTNWAKTSLTRLTGVASRVRRVPGQAASPPSEAQKSCFDIMIRRSGIYFIVTEASDADEQKHEQRRSDDTIGGIRSYHGRYRIPTRLASQNCDHLRNLFRGRGRISEFP
jgi:hypothetical protein